jgi:hypothetical protein
VDDADSDADDDFWKEVEESEDENGKDRETSPPTRTTVPAADHQRGPPGAQAVSGPIGSGVTSASGESVDTELNREGIRMSPDALHTAIEGSSVTSPAIIQAAESSGMIRVPDSPAPSIVTLQKMRPVTGQAELSLRSAETFLSSGQDGDAKSTATRAPKMRNGQEVDFVSEEIPVRLKGEKQGLTPNWYALPYLEFDPKWLELHYKDLQAQMQDTEGQAAVEKDKEHKWTEDAAKKSAWTFWQKEDDQPIRM